MNRNRTSGLNFTSIYNSPIFNIIQRDDDLEDLSYNVHNPSLD